MLMSMSMSRLLSTCSPAYGPAYNPPAHGQEHSHFFFERQFYVSPESPNIKVSQAIMQRRINSTSIFAAVSSVFIWTREPSAIMHHA
jgi:hypothetical protein